MIDDPQFSVKCIFALNRFILILIGVFHVQGHKNTKDTKLDQVQIMALMYLTTYHHLAY